MILSDLQTLDRMLDADPHRRIVVTPIIDPQAQFGPASVDVRLGYDFRVGKSIRYTHFDEAKGPEELRREVAKYTEVLRLRPVERIVLHPREFVLASTLEYVCLPDDVTARLEGRSSWGRIGLQVHATAGFVDPGFRGVLTFELQNVGRVPFSLYSGIRIAQLCFYESGAASIPYGDRPGSKYFQATDAASSLYYKDPEFDRIRQISAMVEELALKREECERAYERGRRRRTERVKTLEQEIAHLEQELSSRGIPG